MNTTVTRASAPVTITIPEDIAERLLALISGVEDPELEDLETELEHAIGCRWFGDVYKVTGPAPDDDAEDIEIFASIVAR